MTSVPKCCSASVSVGAISAACLPASAARSIAYRATSVLPEPTSPISSRCIGESVARSASISSKAASWSAVGSNGRDSSQAPTASPAGGRAAARRLSRRRARRLTSEAWYSASSSKARRRRASSAAACVAGKWAAASASPADG